MHKVIVPLLGILAVTAAVLAAACGDTAEGPGTATPAPRGYHNDKYGYAVRYPEEWRVASSFMESFGQVRSDPSRTRDPEDWVVLTSLSESEEQQFIHWASDQTGPALYPWFEFAMGESVHIFPTHLGEDAFLANLTQGGVVRENSDAAEETLQSGVSVARVTRREVDDNGEFTYDAVYMPFGSGDCAPFGPCEGIIIRIVKTPDSDDEAFEMIFRSFSND